MTAPQSLTLHVDTKFGNNITTILTNFTSDMYIESRIVFTVLSDVDLNQTLLECISEHLDDDRDNVLVNIAGIMWHIVKCAGLIMSFPPAPLTPTGLLITADNFAVMNSTITLSWDPPQGTGPQLNVDFYWISIIPTSLSHPVLNNVITPPFSVTIGYNTVYTVNITAVNCAGQSGTLSLENIEYSKCWIVLYYTLVILMITYYSQLWCSNCPIQWLPRELPTHERRGKFYLQM